MIVTYNWLKEFVDIEKSPEEIAELLTNSGNEVEEIIYQDRYLKHVVVGKILEIEQHPNADKLVVCKVDIGEITQIVTAAKNIKVGDKVPVSLPGADLANGIHIEKSSLRGVESIGMFCSIEELGVTDYDGDANGIMILDDDAVVGEPIADALMMNDVIFDVNVTANRPDCMSVIGLAREVSALTGKPLKEQDLSYTVDESDNVNSYVSVEVKDKDLCPRYIATAIKDIKIEKSPRWLRAKLVSVGIKPINKIVDITNYVLMEYGQPMHAFDQKYLEGKKIIVRRGRKGESIKVLNQNTYDVDENMLCICDENKPVVIAGIIGGLNSCVIDETMTAVFESASFERSCIRRTSRKIGVRTDSTARFEKGVDIGSPEVGMQRALNLICKLNAGTIVSGVIDTVAEKPKDVVREFSLNRIEKILGLKVEDKKVCELLCNLGIKSTVEGDKLTCIVPIYRSDIENDADVAEEVIRMYGYNAYDNIIMPPLYNAKVTVGKYDDVLKLAHDLKVELCEYGYYETVNFSICSQDVRDKLLISKDSNLYNMIKIANPISEDIGYVRTSMANAMFTTIARNLSHKNADFRLCEVGRVYIPKQLPLTEIPEEINMLSFATVNGKDDFFTVKGIVENLLRRFELNYKFEYSKVSYMHPGVSADIINVDTNEVIGSFGKVHPQVCKNFDMQNTVYYGELNLDILAALKEKSHVVKMLSKFPAVDRDLAIVCDESLTIAQILECVKKSCGKLYHSAKVFDIYRSEQLGENKKSVAFSFKLVDYEKTLTDEEITQTVNKILKDLKYKCGAELR